MSKSIKSLALLISVSAFALPGFTQQVVLDGQTRAGPLVLFPSVSDPNEYYYAATSARLARQGDLPRFGFTQYVRPDVSSESITADGTGGGIVTAVVELGATEEELDQARDALRDVNGSGQIIGPVTFSSGTLALVSSFAEPGSETTTTVLGIGNAPLLEGNMAAVSMRLTREGAQELAGNFGRAQPDISFSFNMEVEGYRAPKQARIEANFDRIYEHQAFEAGVATPYLQAEIELAFDDLRRQGAIQITQIGEDEKMEELISTAYERLIDIIFQKAESTGVNQVQQLAAAASGNSDESLLDKANALLERRRDEADEANEGIRARNAARGERAARASQTERRNTEATSTAETAEISQSEMNSRAEAARARATQAEADAERLRGEGNEEEAEAAEQSAALFRRQAENFENMSTERGQDASAARERTTQQPSGESEDSSDSSSDPEEEMESEQQAVPIAIVASYRMKRVRESGTYRIDLNKYTADKLDLRFDAPLDDMTAYRDDDRIFGIVDLANTAFRQREVPVFIDGLNQADFGEYINFATILLEKERGGRTTTDEVRIDRLNFQQNANNFKLVYNKLLDEDLDDFLSYRYKILWNFFGGTATETDWIESEESGIGLAPPLQRRTVFLEGAADTLADEGVRSVEVKIYYDLYGEESVIRESLRPDASGGISQPLTFMLPADSYEYAYEITWRMDDRSRRETGRIPSEDSTLYLDEVPEA